MTYIESMGGFKRWVDGDIFGFGARSGSRRPPAARPEGPIHDIKSDVVMEFMMGHQINGMTPVLEFCNQIRWGDQNGAMQMVISPLGSYKSIIRRLQTDLEGNKVWACRKILPYKEILDASIEIDENLALGILNKIAELNHGMLDSPSHDYNGLESLVARLSRVVQRKGVIPELFVYRGALEKKKNERYIIWFEVRGHGVEAPGSARVEQFEIDMSYNPGTGMIRSFGHDIQSPSKGHVWYPQPSEWDEYFSSGQSDEEIIDCITAALSTY